MKSRNAFTKRRHDYPKRNFHSRCHSSRQVLSLPHFLLYKRDNCNREGGCCIIEMRLFPWLEILCVHRVPCLPFSLPKSSL